MAEVCVFSQSFLRSEKDTVDSIPVCVTFQAIAEKPKILVRFSLLSKLTCHKLSVKICIIQLPNNVKPQANKCTCFCVISFFCKIYMGKFKRQGKKRINGRLV